MNDLHWPPAVIGSLTLEQVACLASEKPPGQGTLKSAEDYAAQVQDRAAAEAAWGTDSELETR